MPRKCGLYILTILLFLSCTAPLQLNKELDYTNIDLSYDRSLCGISPLPFWFHLTQAEIDVLRNTDKAKAGDPQALLSLALMASGNVRTTEDFKRYRLRVARFVDNVRPVIENESGFRQKGLLLYKLMRKEFLVSDTSYELAGYEFGQSKLSVLFEKGTYNCISSAMLYCILGQWFDMRIEGVLTSGHAFVQITAPDGEKIEVETTSRDGFGWNHTEEFYGRQSSRWFNLRGISGQTYEDYARRRIVKPYQLVSFNMKNQHTDFSRMEVEDVHRLIECRAFIDDTNTQFQKDLVNTYRIELSDLEKKQYSSAIRRFYRIAVLRTGLMLNRCENDSTVVATVNQLFRQSLKVSEQQIDTLLAGDSCIDADSIYGTFTSLVKDVHRLFPKDKAMIELTMKLSRGIINKIANRLQDLSDEKRFDQAVSRYKNAESFVKEQVLLFPHENDIVLQSKYFEEKRHLLLFAEKNFEEFVSFSRRYLEKVKQDTAETDVLFKNALYNIFMYIKHCTENKEIEKAEQLIDIISAFTETDKQFAQNIQWALGEVFRFYFDNADWTEAIRIGRKQIAVDVNNTFRQINSNNLQICYQNWAIKYYNSGNWPRARQILRNCINDTVTTGDECSSKLRELEKKKSF